MVAVYGLIAIQTVVNSVSGNWFEAGLWAVLLLAPLTVILAGKLELLWIAILVGVSTVWTGIPIPYINRFTPAHIVVIGLAFVFMADTAVGRRNAVVWRGPAIAFAIVFAVIAARVAFGRPGSARMGEVGGLGEAIQFVLSGFGFWGAAVCAQRVRDWASVCRVMTGTAFVALAMESASFFLGQRQPGALIGRLYFLFLVPVWLLCSILVSWALNRSGQAQERRRLHTGTIREVAALMVPLLLSATTPHRSRPVFALGIIFGVAWVFGVFWQTARRLVPILAIAMLGLMWIGGDMIPQGTKRALSIFTPSLAAELPQGVEVGWRSDFRTTMYHLAWERVQANPLIGAGFEFKRSELEAMSVSAGLNPADRGLDPMALVGGFHNAVVELAVTCGFPAAALFVFGLLAIVGRYALTLRKLPPSSEKVFAGSVLGYGVAVIGQMLMNGGGQQFFVVCVLAGAMHGMTMVWRARNSSPAGAK